MMFNGTAWENVGTAGFSSGAAVFTSLALDGNGTPNVAFRDDAISRKATVMKFDMPVPACSQVFESCVGVSLKWDLSDNALGYKLYVGKNNPPGDILNGLDVGNDTTYTLCVPKRSGFYYWKVVPFNDKGSPPDCPVNSFNVDCSSASAIPFTWWSAVLAAMMIAGLVFLRLRKG